MTKAELKRRLVPGTKLVLIDCLMGKCHKPRTVKQVRSSDIIMLTDEGKESHLHIASNEYVTETANGFQVWLKYQPAQPGLPEQPPRIAAEYIFQTP